MSGTSKRKSLVVALDFDGVVVTNDFPNIGQRIGAEKWIPQLQAEFNIRVILWTVRSNNSDLETVPSDLAIPGIKVNLRNDFLTQAILECQKQGIRLWAVNINPEQKLWSLSSKVYADIYIDDRALGVPLIKFKSHPEPVINWNLLGPKLYALAYERALQDDN